MKVMVVVKATKESEAGMTPDEKTLAEMGRFKEELVKAGDFLDGVLAVSRTSIFLGADALVGAVDELLQAAAWDAFVTMLPRTRHAFERLHARQRDSLRLAYREHVRKAPQEAADLEQLDHLIGVPLGSDHGAQPVSNVRADVEVRKERGLLRDVPDAALLGRNGDPAAAVEERRLVDDDSPHHAAPQARNDLEQGCFSRARWSENRRRPSAERGGDL